MSTYTYNWGAVLNGAGGAKILADGLTLDARISSGDKAQVKGLESNWIKTIPSYQWNEVFKDFSIANDWQNWLALPVGTRLLLYKANLLPEILHAAIMGGNGYDSYYPALIWFYTKYTTGNWSLLLDRYPDFVAQGKQLTMVRGQVKAFTDLETAWLQSLYGSHYGDPDWAPLVTDQTDWINKVPPGVRLLFYVKAADTGSRTDGAANKGQIAGWLPTIFANYATSADASNRALFWAGLDKIVEFYHEIAPASQPAQSGTPGDITSPPAASGSATPAAAGMGGLGLGLLAVAALFLFGGGNKR